MQCSERSERKLIRHAGTDNGDIIRRGITAIIAVVITILVLSAPDLDNVFKIISVSSFIALMIYTWRKSALLGKHYICVCNDGIYGIGTKKGKPFSTEKFDLNYDEITEITLRHLTLLRVKISETTYDCSINNPKKIQSLIKETMREHNITTGTEKPV